jgi:hypothetical protein
MLERGGDGEGLILKRRWFIHAAATDFFRQVMNKLKTFLSILPRT